MSKPVEVQIEKVEAHVVKTPGQCPAQYKNYTFLFSDGSKSVLDDFGVKTIDAKTGESAIYTKEINDYVNSHSDDFMPQLSREDQNVERRLLINRTTAGVMLVFAIIAAIYQIAIVGFVYIIATAYLWLSSRSKFNRFSLLWLERPMRQARMLTIVISSIILIASLIIISGLLKQS